MAQSFFQQFFVQLADDGLIARLGRDLGDARPHQPTTYYSNFINTRQYFSFLSNDYIRSRCEANPDAILLRLNCQKMRRLPALSSSGRLHVGLGCNELGFQPVSKDKWNKHLCTFHVLLILFTKVLNILDLLFLGSYYQEYGVYHC